MADNVVAGKAYLAFDAVCLADDCLKQRGFAGAVGADDGNDLACMDGNIDMIDGAEFVIESGQAFHGQKLACCCRAHGLDHVPR